MKTKALQIPFALAALCLSFLSYAQAVVPAPDGGYAGGNTAEGQNALLGLTTGTSNTAVGWFSLRSITTGKFCTGVGAATLLANTADSNTATGTGALLSNTTGAGNTAEGAFALVSNTTGSSNTAVGNVALEANTGGENTAVGNASMQDNTTGSGNTAVGNFALNTNGAASFNTAVGDLALGFNGSGSGNTAMGADALCCADAGNNNTLVGSEVMSMVLGSTGNNNTAIGSHALESSTGSNNVAVGHDAGHDLTTGDNNIDIGNEVVGLAGEHDTIRIGNSNISTTIIRGVSGATIASGATVLVGSNGQLGTMTSSERLKREIKPMDKVSEAILALRPVSFRYKKEIDPEGIPQFGLVAEEVQKVNPDLVVRDSEGRPETVRYEQVNAMLLNEFLKEHKTVQELKSTIQKQEEIIAQHRQSFEARLAEQETQIAALISDLHRVSAQLEATQPPAKLVATDR